MNYDELRQKDTMARTKKDSKTDRQKYEKTKIRKDEKGLRRQIPMN